MVVKEQYAVVVCSECEFVRIVDQTNKTSKCGRCGKQKKMKQMKKFVTTDSQEKARLVASEVRAKQKGYEDDFHEAYENGEFDLSNYSGVSGPRDWVGEDGSNNSSTSRSDKQIVLDVISDCECPTFDNIVDGASVYGLDEEKTEKLLSRLRRSGDVLKSNQEYRVL